MEKTIPASKRRGPAKPDGKYIIVECLSEGKAPQFRAISLPVAKMIGKLNPKSDGDVLKETDCANGVPIPLFIDADTFDLVVAWCQRHIGDPTVTYEHGEEKPLKTDAPWQKDPTLPLPAADHEDFERYSVPDPDNQEVLYKMLMAADDLEIPGLYYMLTRTVASWMRGKTMEQLRDFFAVPEEERMAMDGME